MGLKNLQKGESVPTLEVKDGGRKLIFDMLYCSNQLIENTIGAKSYPIVTPSIEFEVKKRIRAGRYQLYLLTDRGATATLSENVTVDDKSVFELKSNPELTNRIIASNIFANAVGLSANRRTIIISLLVGLLLGAILATWVFLLFVH